MSHLSLLRACRSPAPAASCLLWAGHTLTQSGLPSHQQQKQRGDAQPLQHLYAQQQPAQEPLSPPAAHIILPPLHTPDSTLGWSLPLDREPSTPSQHECESPLIPGLPPALECAVPKKKVSNHRQSQRQQWYHLRHKKEIQQCPVCGAVGGSNTVLPGGCAYCSGASTEGKPKKNYQPEYKPPC